MGNSNSVMIHKLQNAINGKGCRLLINKSQFYSNDQDRPITIYYVKQAIFDSERGRNQNIELFHSTSEIQIVLFLRDYWFKLNDWELPTDNETWNKVRDKLEVFSGGGNVDSNDDAPTPKKQSNQKKKRTK